MVSLLLLYTYTLLAFTHPYASHTYLHIHTHTCTHTHTQGDQEECLQKASLLIEIHLRDLRTQKQLRTRADMAAQRVSPCHLQTTFKGEEGFSVLWTP